METTYTPIILREMTTTTMLVRWEAEGERTLVRIVKAKYLVEQGLTEQKVLDAGGNLWESGSHRRIYLNNLAIIAGLECERYGTGNIRSAYYQGKAISNGRASRLEATLDTAKVWYDCNTGKLCGKNLSDDLLDDIETALLAA